MDFKTLMETVDAMNDEELFLAEKKIHEARKRRRAEQLASLPTSVGDIGQAHVVIDLVHMVNAVRESIRQDMSLCSEAALASVLDEIRDYSQTIGDETVVTQLLQIALTATLIHETRCEAARRLDSVR